jgi:peptidoglycan/LPS O-acetylase OafA/YrhL
MMCVFCHHTLPKDAEGYNLPKGLASFMAEMVNASSFGLCLFFALSAYLICELLLREKQLAGRVDMARFYKRRILRIWPLYYLGLLIGGLWSWHYGTLHADAKDFLAYALFMPNLVYMITHAFGGIASGPAGPLWSISLEEQFYLLWPSVVRFCSERGLWLFVGLIFVTANLTLVYLGLHHAQTDSVVWFNSFVQSYMFASGILLVLLLKGRMPVFSDPVRVLLVLSLPCCWFLAVHADNLKNTSGRVATVGQLLSGYLLVALGCIAFMLSLMGVSRVPAWAAALGRLSYGIYVFHLLAFAICRDIVNKLHLRHPLAVAEVPALLLSVALAWLSYQYFEKPFRRMKDRAAIIHTQPAP